MKISDFKLAEFFIRGLCKTHRCPFVDLPLEFGDTFGFNGRALTLTESEKLSKTIFQIVAAYLQNIEKISGSPFDLTREERTLIINTTLSLVRDMTYSSKTFPEAIRDETVSMHANQDPFVWTIMKSVICPAFDKPLKNVLILARRSPYIDGAKYLRKGDIAAKDESIFPFVFTNLEIENQSCRVAYLLFEIIRAHEMDPRGIVHDLFNKEELWAKFNGLAKAAFRTTDAINDFMTTLSILADEMSSVDKRLIQEKNASKKWTAKTGLWSQSQYAGGGHGSWWYLGLIERMLEPARGSDWSGYYTMKPFTDELYAKIEKEKKRRGLSELSLELLLRVQSEEFKQQPDLIIQGLLSDNRVW